MKVYIVPNTGKADAMEVGRRAAGILLAAGAEVILDKQGAPILGLERPARMLPEEEALAACDLILTIGGDGTLLHAARRDIPWQKPLLGVNVGRLGFLTLVEADDLEVLGRLCSGDYSVQPRSLLAARLPDAGAEPCLALNDVVLFKHNAERTISLDIYCDDILVSRFRGDGIVFATPTGSTAYSMSAGGPILDAELDGIIVTQICAHIVQTPPMVFAPSRVLRVALRGSTGENLAVICDGRRLHTLSPGSTVCVGQAGHSVPLVQFDGGEQLRSIDTKLKGR